MNELEEIKKRKLEQMQHNYDGQLQQEAQLVQQIEDLENMVRPKLTKDALQRYGNLKSAHPEKAIQILAVLGQILQTEKIKQIDDGQLKAILLKITPEKKEFKIKKI